ncbi:DotU family type IV/VI secretion system protein [Salmonella enterica]|nr:DotU family type IV/VI secretion system protein [Salmonella enterica]EMD7797652.1 DotU family type IV/VI secretion system protein [Salmonella enterica]
MEIDHSLLQTWAWVAAIKNGQPVSGDRSFYQQGVQYIEVTRQRLTGRALPGDVIDAILYAQCALLDETVLTAPANGENACWREMPLQVRFFGSFDAGNQLYRFISEALRAPEPNYLVLQCYQCVLASGFLGQYSGEMHPERQKIYRTLNERLSSSVFPPVSSLLTVIASPKFSLRRVFSLSGIFWLLLAGVIAVALIAQLHIYILLHYG